MYWRWIVAAALQVVAASHGWADQIADGERAFTAGDYETARLLFSEEAENGNPEGAFQLGHLYDVGAGVRQDKKQAKQWFERAARAGNTNAMWRLGSLYEYSQFQLANTGVKPALYWYVRAAQRGDRMGLLRVFDVLDRGKEDVRENPTLAFRCALAAAESGDQAGMTMVANAYSMGRGVPQNFVREYMWRSLSLASPHKRSKGAFGELMDGMATMSRNMGEESLRSLSRRLTPQQIADGQELAAKWTPTEGVVVDAELVRELEEEIEFQEARLAE